MKTEALKMALEALLDLKDDCSGCEFEWSNDYPLQAKALQAIDKVLAQQCVCGEPNSSGIHRTDGPCLAPQPEQEPVALQMDVIVVNLVREGINKHRARELAEHFIKHTTPPQRTAAEGEDTRRAWVGLTDEERKAIRAKATEYTDITDWNYTKRVQEATELALQEKNK